MAYSERQLLAFSQLAYVDLEAKYNAYCQENNTDTAPLYELIKDDPSTLRILESCDVSRQEMSEWKIAGVWDDNDNSGLYACIIETADNQAAVAFRGSENPQDLNNLRDDWLFADLGLLNSTMTNQHASAELFLSKYKKKLNQYDKLTMTGHSLGGNVAEYSTIVSEKYGLDDNIDQCVSLDGPGFSGEFLRKYQDEIQRMSRKMKHLQWSMVGDLLKRLPGVDFITVNVSNLANQQDDDEYNSATRHDMKFVDRKGEDFARGEQDLVTKVLDTFTRGMDNLPKPVGDTLLDLVVSTVLIAVYTKEAMYDDNGQLTEEGKKILTVSAGVITALISSGMLVPVIQTVSLIVLTVVVIAIAATVAQFVADMITAAAEHLCNALLQVYNWAAGKVKELMDYLYSIIDSTIEWINKTFNSGYKYALANTYIRIDTGAFHDCGCRLEALYSRVDSVDGLLRMIMMAPELNLSEFSNMQNASWAFKNSSKLKSCASYLFSTSEAFDEIEKSRS